MFSSRQLGSANGKRKRPEILILGFMIVGPLGCCPTWLAIVMVVDYFMVNAKTAWYQEHGSLLNALVHERGFSQYGAHYALLEVIHEDGSRSQTRIAEAALPRFEVGDTISVWHADGHYWVPAPTGSPIPGVLVMLTPPFALAMVGVWFIRRKRRALKGSDSDSAPLQKGT